MKTINISAHVDPVHGIRYFVPIKGLPQGAITSLREIIRSLDCFICGEDRENISKHVESLRSRYCLLVLIDGEVCIF
jgi:hypothetical protein